jgi:hypothetical protein
VPHARFCSMTFHGLKHRTKAKYSEAQGARRQDFRAPAIVILLRSMTVIRDAFHTSDKSSYTQSRP